MNALSRLVTRRPKRILAATLVLAAVAIAASTSLSDRLAPFAADDPETESVRAQKLLERAGVNAGVDVVALVKTPAGAESASGRARIRAVAAKLGTAPDVGRVVTPAEGGRSMIAADGRSTYVSSAGPGSRGPR
jgi:hypothetical protein